MFGAQAAPPEISLSGPHALRPGSAAVLVLKGKELAATRALWTTWAGVLERSDAEGWECLDDRVNVPVFVPAGHPAGFEMIRILATNGVSNPLWIILDGLRAETAEGRDVHITKETARSIVPPVAIDGTCADAGVRYHRIELNEGQRISMEVVAQRLGMPTDPVLRLLDGAGREIGYVNDTPGLGADCGLEFRAPSAGQYLIEVRDAEYAGGAEQRYRLRVGDFPVGVLSRLPAIGGSGDSGSGPVEVPWESSVSSRKGAARGVLAQGGGTSGTTARLRLPASLRGEALVPRLLAIDGIVIAEREPNDDAELAIPIASGQAVAGRFDHALDVDWYQFVVATSGWWRVEARSRSLGWAGDPQLRLTRADGTFLTGAASGGPDPCLHHRFETAGTYRVSVSDAGRRHGPGRGYVLELDSQAGAFRISTELERVHVPVGGKGSLKIKIEPRGYTGPIRIEAEGLPEGLELENPDVEAGKKEWDLVILGQPGSLLGTARPVRFLARATAEGMVGTARLQLGPAQRKVFPRMPSIPPGFLDEVWVGVVSGNGLSGL